MKPGISRNINFLLWELIDDIRQGSFARCKSAGLSTEDIRLLSRLQLDDICYISSSGVSVFCYRVDPALLRALIAQAREARARKTQAERALSLGASARMMNYFFGWTGRDVARYRELTPDSTFTRGRPPIPSEASARDILQRLRDSAITPDTPDHDVLEILMEIAQLTGVPLCSVWHVIDEAMTIISGGTGHFSQPTPFWQRLALFDLRDNDESAPQRSLSPADIISSPTDRKSTS
ncbi:TPA: DUF2857 domain-containing protein [Klebsiella variicola]|nr:DUF2857 domain-containing protein [Klebsiella variicola]